MSILREINRIQQPPGEPRRRWFDSPEMDLMVWYDDCGQLTGFQLSYDKPVSEHSLSWRRDRGYEHLAVDDGESGAGMNYKETPILIPDGYFDPNRLHRMFLSSSETMPAALVAFVSEKILAYPDPGSSRKD
jgi:hypothetical protein